MEYETKISQILLIITSGMNPAGLLATGKMLGLPYTMNKPNFCRVLKKCGEPKSH